LILTALLLSVLDQAELIAVRVCHNHPLDTVLAELFEFMSSQILHAANCRIKVGYIQIYVDSILLFVSLRYFLKQERGTFSLVPKS
jgi:hypothetical protein